MSGGVLARIGSTLAVVRPDGTRVKPTVKDLVEAICRTASHLHIDYDERGTGPWHVYVTYKGTHISTDGATLGGALLKAAKHLRAAVVP